MAHDITVPARSHSHGSAKAKAGSGSKNGPVGYIKVNRIVWDAAMVLAERKVERIDVHSPTKVDVWMTARPRRH